MHFGSLAMHEWVSKQLEEDPLHNVGEITGLEVLLSRLRLVSFPYVTCSDQRGIVKDQSAQLPL